MADRARILCVDDEPQVLAGLSLNLGRRFEVATATSGAEALQQLQEKPGFAVVMSDMRMPGMDGATFLSLARIISPHTTRLLLTGQADLASAMAAVNEGQIMRFMQKPTLPHVLVRIIEAAVEQHRLQTAEKVLLEQTLHGSIKALTEVLALLKPLLFGRAVRIKQYVSELAENLSLPDPWQLEVAAMLSQMGAVILSDDIASKLHYGQKLTVDEQCAVNATADVAEQLISHIPRLERVRDLMKRSAAPLHPCTSTDEGERALHRGAQVLRIAMEFDRLVSKGVSPNDACAELSQHTNQYEPTTLEALAWVAHEARGTVKEVNLVGLRPGMIFADDVLMTSGSLLVTRGYVVTPSFLERLRTFQPGVLRLPLRVHLKPT